MDTNSDAVSDLQVALNDFSLNFLKSYHQTGDKDSNLFYSSISLSSTLSLLLSGSDGITKQQLVGLLGYNDLVKNQQVEVAFKKLNEGFKLKDLANNPIFSMVNRLYFKKNTKLVDDFQVLSKEAYDSDLLEADFENESKKLVAEINEWVKLETKEKIQNALDEIPASTMILLINVVYFKGKWKKKLSLARSMEFTNLNSEIVKVETMSIQDDFQYGEFEQYRILQLDYIGNSAMYILLPNEDVNLHNLLLELNTRKVNEQLRELESTSVDLQMPKFKLTTDIDLITVLEQLGLKALFNEETNLSKMSNEPGLVVTKALQKAFLDVDEEGTEAAAVTAFVIEQESMVMSDEIKFYVNRPFIFLIRMNGVNIFAGAIKQF